MRKDIHRRIRRKEPGLDLVADIEAVVSVNVNRGRRRGGVEHDDQRTADPSNEGGHGATSETVGASMTPTPRREVSKMAEQSQQYKRLTREELDELSGEPLPERAAMSLVNANIAIPINAALAANVLSDDAIAYANAAQTTPIDQGT